MRQKIIAAILFVCLILLVMVLYGMGMHIHQLRGRVSELQTRVAVLEAVLPVPHHRIWPYYEFIETPGENGVTQADDSAIPLDPDIVDRINSQFEEEYPDKVIIKPSPDADR